MQRILIGCAGILLLSGCSRASELPPAEVMKRAALASGTLQSAAFTLEADIALPPSSGSAVHAEMEGVLQQGGKDAMFTLDVRGKIPSQSGLHDVEANLDAVVTWGREAFVRLNALFSDPPYPLLPLDQLSSIEGVWWRIPGDGGTASDLSPDPNLLLSQSKVVTVTRDRGIQRIHGVEAYRYDVSIDPEKLATFLQEVAQRDGREFDRASALEDLRGYSANGELWIDARSFHTHRIQWEIVPIDSSRGLTLALQAELTNHDRAAPVVPPSSSTTLQNGAFLEGILSGSASHLNTPSATDDDMSVLDVMVETQGTVTNTGSALPDSILPLE